MVTSGEERVVRNLTAPLRAPLGDVVGESGRCRRVLAAGPEDRHPAQAAGFDLRMRLAPPDTHDRTRKIAEAVLPPAELKAFTTRERRRASRAAARTPTAHA